MEPDYSYSYAFFPRKYPEEMVVDHPADKSRDMGTSFAVIMSEIACLNQGDVCEMEIIPVSKKDGKFEDASICVSILHREFAALNQGDCEMEIVPREGLSKTYKFDTQEDWEWRHRRRFQRCRQYKTKGDLKLFIPMNKFNINHLPEDFRHPDLVKKIKATSLRVVRITVGYTARDRPKRFQSNARESLYYRFGTGTVDVNKSHDFNKKNGSKSSEGEEEEEENSNNLGFGFVIHTAAHLVFNDKEASDTLVEFFHDDDYQYENVIKAKGVKVLSIDEEHDVCDFLCQVDDFSMGETVMEKLDESVASDDINPQLTKDFAYCISHVHGTAKKVSIGTMQPLSESNESTKIGIIKMLLHRCCSILAIDISKVLYTFFAEHGFVQLGVASLDLASQSVINMAIFTHLEKKELIEQPFLREKKKIENELNTLKFQLMLHGLQANSKKSPAQHSSNRKHMQASDFKVINKVVSHMVSKIHFTEDLKVKLDNIQAEIFVKLTEMRNEGGLGVPDTTPGFKPSPHADYLNYFVPTCFGSSGAPVVAIMSKDSKIQSDFVRHSKVSMSKIFTM